jgi:hypothetical protein
MAGTAAEIWRRPGGRSGAYRCEPKEARWPREGVEVVAEAHHQAAQALEVAGDHRNRPSRRQHEEERNGEECERVRRGEDSGRS